MGRIRTIKPEFFRHEDLYEAEKATKLPIRVAYAGLWTCCDREGRFKWRPRSLKVEILPYDECDFARVLDALLTRGFIVKYRVNGEDYGHVPSFLSHQFINNREAPSTIPEPSLNEQVDASVTRGPRVLDARGTDVVKEGKGKEGEGRVQDALPEWLPLEPWKAFLEMRKKMRGWTARAEKLTLNELDRLRQAGHSPAAVLDQSVQRGYRGVFEVKSDGRSTGSNAKSGSYRDPNSLYSGSEYAAERRPA
jgi:hypothetical protein